MGCFIIACLFGLACGSCVDEKDQTARTRSFCYSALNINSPNAFLRWWEAETFSIDFNSMLIIYDHGSSQIDFYADRGDVTTIYPIRSSIPRSFFISNSIDIDHLLFERGVPYHTDNARVNHSAANVPFADMTFVDGDVTRIAWRDGDLITIYSRC